MTLKEKSQVVELLTQQRIRNCKKMRQVSLKVDRFSSHEVTICLTEIYDLNIDIISPNVEMLASVSEISRRYDITFYDAVYIVLAQELGLDFVTADSRLYHKTKTLRFVKLL